ncbi:MAG: LuxR C-terminal-related transcriptional regulator [Limisphaerales bacterium]
MSLLKIGRRYGLCRRQQAAELSSPEKHVRHAAIQSRPQLATTPLPNNFHLRTSSTLNRKALKLERSVYCETSVNWGVNVGDLHKGLPSEQAAQSNREAAAGGAPMSADASRLVCAPFQAIERGLQVREKLTSSEQDMFKLLRQRFLEKAIADHFNISEETIRPHTGHTYEKFHVNRRGDAVTAWRLTRSFNSSWQTG